MESTKIDTDYFNYIDIDAIDNKNNEIINSKHISKKNAPSRASRKLHSGDVLFSLVRPYLKNIAIIKQEFSDYVASTGFYVCTPMSFLNSEYLFYFLISPYCINRVMHFMEGNNSPSIRGCTLESLYIGIPNYNEQKRIVNKIKNLYNLIIN